MMWRWPGRLRPGRPAVAGDGRPRQREEHGEVGGSRQGSRDGKGGWSPPQRPSDANTLWGLGAPCVEVGLLYRRHIIQSLCSDCGLGIPAFTLALASCR